MIGSRSEEADVGYLALLGRELLELLLGRGGSVRHEFLQHSASRVSKSASVPLRLQGGCGCRADGLDEGRSQQDR